MKLLLVSSRFPWPPWRGNQLRTIQWLDALRDHERLLICPPTDDGADPAGGDVEAPVPSRNRGRERHRRRRRCPRGSAGPGGALRIGCREEARGSTPCVTGSPMWRWSRWSAAAGPPMRSGGSDPGLPVIFDAIDCMALHYHRAAASASGLTRPVFRWEAERCRRRETELVAAAAVTHRGQRQGPAGPRGGRPWDGRRGCFGGGGRRSLIPCPPSRSFSSPEISGIGRPSARPCGLPTGSGRGFAIVSLQRD